MQKIKFLAISLIFSLMNICVSSAFAEGRAKISLKPDVQAEYFSDNADPWLDDSWVSDSTDFNLDVTSLAKSESIFSTKLVLAIPNDADDGDWSFTLGGTEFKYDSFSGTGLHPYLAPHGVFAKENGALWAEFDVGTLLAKETKSISFSGLDLPHGMLIHFDAYGSSSESAQNGWYFNPYSHDTTVTPEPISSALFLSGGAALVLRRRLRRKNA